MLTGRFERPLFIGVAVALAVTGCSGSHGTRAGAAAVERAITLYIEGEYVAAEQQLRRLTESLDNDEDRRAAYLYLGRTYMALADYARAAEAFAAGKRLGGGVRFDEYLTVAAQRVVSSPRTIRAQTTVTRGDLAALIVAFFGEKIQQDPGSIERLQGAVAAAPHVRSVLASGVMTLLPDGGFHADREVTSAALYFVLRRLVARVGVPRAVFEELYYPQGVRSAVTTAGRPSPATAERLVTGNDVVRVLQAVVSASDPSRD